MEFNLPGVLGHDVTSDVVDDAIQTYQLTEIDESPPFRRYYSSSPQGLSLLAENDRVIDIQIYVQAIQGFSAFSDPLPFGIRPGMQQEQVHELLGTPTRSDKFDSHYELPELGAKLTVDYDDSSTVKYLSIAFSRR
jgi:hypothetical protein